MENQIPDYVIKDKLPEGSSRQVVRAELERRAFRNLSDKFKGPRAERRAFARRIAKDLWKAGERLS